MSVRRSLIVLLLLFSIMPICAFGVNAALLIRGREPAQNLRFYSVGQGDVSVFITGIGKVEAESVANLSFVRPGRVTEVVAQPGDMVAAGDILAKLASDDEQIAYDRALLGLQLAELQKQDLTEPVDESSIRIAEANLNSAWGAYLGIQNAVAPADLQSAELRYQQALDAVTDAQKVRTTAAGGQADEAYQLLDAQVGTATFNAEVARLQLEVLRGGNQGALNAAYGRVVQAQKELERVQAGPTQAQIDQADITIQQAQAQVDAAAGTLSQMLLSAPFDGVVSMVNIEVGSIVVPSLAAFELTDISPLHVTVQIDEIDIQQIQEGMFASVKLDALSGVELKSTIDSIALVGTNNNGIISYDVQVRLDESDPRVRAGMTAEAAVVVAERQEVLSVPNEYIRLDRQRDTAYVNMVGDDGRLQETEIKLELRGDVTSEVVDGLKVGDVLAVDLGGDRISLFGG